MKKHFTLYHIMTFFSFGLFLLLAFGLNLPYNLANNNIVLHPTVLPDVLLILIDLIETLTFAIGFSILVFAMVSRVPSAKLALLFLCATLFHRICDLAVALILYHGLSLEDILFYLFYFLADALLLLGAWLIAKHQIKKHFKRTTPQSKASSLFGKTEEDLIQPTVTAFYPFKKIYSKENPCQACALMLGILLSAVKIFDRILFDIGYGAPKDFGEVLVMIVYYSSDILLGVIFYVFSMFVFHRLFRRFSSCK